jgi:hypothetical protein
MIGPAVSTAERFGSKKEGEATEGLKMLTLGEQLSSVTFTEGLSESQVDEGRPLRSGGTRDEQRSSR